MIFCHCFFEIETTLKWYSRSPEDKFSCLSQLQHLHLAQSTMVQSPRAASMSEFCTKHILIQLCHYLPTDWNGVIIAEVWKTNNRHFQLFECVFSPKMSLTQDDSSSCPINIHSATGVHCCHTTTDRCAFIKLKTMETHCMPRWCF